MVYKMPQKFINILYLHGTVYCVIQILHKLIEYDQNNLVYTERMI